MVALRTADLFAAPLVQASLSTTEQAFAQEVQNAVEKFEAELLSVEDQVVEEVKLALARRFFDMVHTHAYFHVPGDLFFFVAQLALLLRLLMLKPGFARFQHFDLLQVCPIIVRFLALQR